MSALDEVVYTDYTAAAERAELWAPWRDHAACYGRTPEMDLCRICPVLRDCRDWLLRVPPKEDPGDICGGWTEAERTKARTQALMTAEKTTTKQCRTCWEWKGPEDYSPDKRGYDGLQANCKPCIAKRMRESRQRKRAAA